jgi:hypothetical protein
MACRKHGPQRPGRTPRQDRRAPPTSKAHQDARQPIAPHLMRSLKFSASELHRFPHIGRCYSPDPERSMATEWTESLRDLITTILEINITIQGNRMNLIMKKVTS